MLDAPQSPPGDSRLVRGALGMGSSRMFFEESALLGPRPQEKKE